MNKRLQGILVDMVIALALSLALAYGLSQFLPKFYDQFAVFLLPLFWLALRHGWATGVLGAAATGLISSLIIRQYNGQDLGDWVSRLLVFGLPMLVSGIAGLFAKYTQKTLNNRRFSSTYLNIGTSALLVSIAYYLLTYWIVPMVVDVKMGLNFGSKSFYLATLFTFLALGLSTAIFAKINDRFLIPKRSRFLSRKERSALLND